MSRSKGGRVYEVIGALIGATAGGASADGPLGIASVIVFAIVGATIGAVASSGVRGSRSKGTSDE